MILRARVTVTIIHVREDVNYLSKGTVLFVFRHAAGTRTLRRWYPCKQIIHNCEDTWISWRQSSNISKWAHYYVWSTHRERDDSSSMGIFEIISYFRTKKMVILNLLLYSLLKKKEKKSKKPMNGACEDYQYAPLSIILFV